MQLTRPTLERALSALTYLINLNLVIDDPRTKDQKAADELEAVLLATERAVTILDVKPGAVILLEVPAGASAGQVDGLLHRLKSAIPQATVVPALPGTSVITILQPQA